MFSFELTQFCSIYSTSKNAAKVVRVMERTSLSLSLLTLSSETLRSRGRVKQLGYRRIGQRRNDNRVSKKIGLVRVLRLAIVFYTRLQHNGGYATFNRRMRSFTIADMPLRMKTPVFFSALTLPLSPPPFLVLSLHRISSWFAYSQILSARHLSNCGVAIISFGSFRSNARIRLTPLAQCPTTGVHSLTTRKSRYLGRIFYRTIYISIQ